MEDRAGVIVEHYVLPILCRALIAGWFVVMASFFGWIGYRIAILAI